MFILILFCEFTLKGGCVYITNVTACMDRQFVPPLKELKISHFIFFPKMINIAMNC